MKPSADLEAERVIAAMTAKKKGKPLPMVIKISATTKRAIKTMAASKGVTVKRYLLDLVRRDGVSVEAADLEGGGE